MNYFKYLYVALLLMVITSYNVLAQNEKALNDTTTAIITEESQNLLPKKYLFTQKLLWGEKGVMRNINIFKLSPESRDLEQDIRDKMFKAHRYIGYATLAGMVAQGIVGERLYSGNTGLKDLHEGLAGAVNIGYFTTAGLALFAPPRMNDRPKGFSTYKLHKYLVLVHLSSMIATNILSGMVEDNPSLKPYHRATAYVAYSSFLVSMVVINF